MKKKTSVTFLVICSIAVALFLSLPGVSYSFWWYGTDINEHLDDVITPPAGDPFNSAEELHSLLNDINIQYTPMGNYNNNPDGITGVRINVPKKTWGEYTLISDFSTSDCAGLPAAPEPAPRWGYCGEPGANPMFCCDPENPVPWRCQLVEPACSMILIDKEGNRVNGWVSGWGPAQMLPNGDVLVSTQGGGTEGDLVQLNWYGEEINRWGAVHHDHQREGNPVQYYAPGLRAKTDSGITMRLTRQEVSVVAQNEKVQAGEWPDIISQYDLEDDVIFQENWEGDAVWEWHASEHFFAKPENGDLGLGFAEDGLEAIKNGPFINGIEGKHDYTHVNCTSWLGPNPWFLRPSNGPDYRFHPENIIIDYRSMGIIAIIARYDHPDGLWKSGAIVLRFGPDYSAVSPDRKIGQIIGPHHAHMIPKNLPGWGNILVFDNGGMSGFGSYFPGMRDINGDPLGTYPNMTRDYSRIVEFNPITREVVWEYVQPKPTANYNGEKEVIGNDRKFFAPYYSSAQRLKNGNTLIAEGNTGRVFEVTKEGEIVWEYIHPSGGGFFDFGIYRAYRIPKAWVLPFIVGDD